MLGVIFEKTWAKSPEWIGPTCRQNHTWAKSLATRSAQGGQIGGDMFSFGFDLYISNFLYEFASGRFMLLFNLHSYKKK